MKNLLIFATGIAVGLAAVGGWYAAGTPGLGLVDGEAATSGDAFVDLPFVSSATDAEDESSARRDPTVQSQPEPVEIDGRVIRTGATNGEPQASDRVNVGGTVVETRPFPDPTPADTKRFDASGTSLRELRDGIQQERSRTLRQILRPLPVGASDD